jgi:hypothetical protein
LARCRISAGSAAIAALAAAVIAFIMLSIPAPMSFSVLVTAATGSNLPQL